MIIVLDTSAAVEVVLKRKHSSKLGKQIADAGYVIVPSLYTSEITNVFWKYYQFDSLSIDVCEKSIDLALSLPDDFFSEQELYKEAFSLACITQKPVYDMFFLVLARRHNAYLLTIDKVLKGTAKKQSIRLL